MRFSVLGPVSITDGTDTVVLTPSKPTSLLAALLLRPNQVVSVDFLQNAVWEDSPPPTAKATLQTYVLRLRRLFRNFGISDNAVETVSNGYRFPATGATLDLVEFRELVNTARAQRGEQAEMQTLGRALALWQGPPLANIQSSTLHRDEVPGLVDEWLRLSERRFDIALELGLYGDITADLRAATRAHPGYERFWEQLIEALYRTGRQSDALREYATIKRHLSDELGVDPGPGLQKLELAILRGQELPPRVPTAAAAPPVAEPGPAGCAPGSLPPDLPRFVGRPHEIERLVEQLTAPRTGPLVAVISGPPGIGKSALAVHVAHLVKEQFPAGHAALRLDGPAAPPDPWTFAGLLLIDGVTDVAHVLPLLPAAPHSATIVVSRASLPSLVAARGGYAVRLGPFTADESVEFLAATAGARRVAECPHATRELANLCGDVPAALRTAVSRLIAGGQSVADCVAWLRPDPVRKLSLASDRSMSLLNLFRDYLAGLDPAVVDIYYRLGLAAGELPTPGLSVAACAGVLGQSPYETECQLEQLVEASLLEIGTAGGYVMHPLLLALAEVLASTELVAPLTGGV